MGFDIQVYCNQIPKEIVPQMMKRLNDYDMRVQVHPKFKFDHNEDEGFVPFKFQLLETNLKVLRGKELISGFELYIDNFDLQTTKDELKPKRSAFDKLLGRKQGEFKFAEPHIEEILDNCTTVVSFVAHASNSFEFRFSILVSAIVTELTGGVCFYPSENIWYNDKSISDLAFENIKKYELTLTEETVRYNNFNEW